MANWVVRLGKFDILCWPHPVMKAQVLANFIAKCAWADGEASQEETKKEVSHEMADEDFLEPHGYFTWAVHLIHLIAKYALRFAFQSSNNQAKYEALLAELRIAKELEGKKLKTFIDS